MLRQLDQLPRLFLSGSSVLPCSVLSVEFRVIEYGIGWLCARSQFQKGLLIFFEQGEDDRDDLACNPTHDFALACIPTRSLVETAFDGNQVLVDLAPFAILELNRLPYNEVHHLFHLPLPSWGEPHMIECVPRLRNTRCPSKIGLELRGAL